MLYPTAFLVLMIGGVGTTVLFMGPGPLGDVPEDTIKAVFVSYIVGIVLGSGLYFAAVYL